MIDVLEYSNSSTSKHQKVHAKNTFSMTHNYTLGFLLKLNIYKLNYVLLKLLLDC